MWILGSVCVEVCLIIGWFVVNEQIFFGCSCNVMFHNEIVKQQSFNPFLYIPLIIVSILLGCTHTKKQQHRKDAFSTLIGEQQLVFIGITMFSLFDGDVIPNIISNHIFGVYS